LTILLGAPNAIMSVYCVIVMAVRPKDIYMDAQDIQDDVVRFISCTSR